ncbi:hypothetical protein SAMN04487934_107179 [Eubacterium ruminantium]|nr:hypothetical protein SAMN04487934_107179 [Eubacterium ruminantium]
MRKELVLASFFLAATITFPAMSRVSANVVTEKDNAGYLSVAEKEGCTTFLDADAPVEGDDKGDLTTDGMKLVIYDNPKDTRTGIRKVKYKKLTYDRYCGYYYVEKEGLVFLKKGQIQDEFYGFVRKDDYYYFVSGGCVDYDWLGGYYGTVKGKYGCWYVKHGKVNFAYTGFEDSNSGSARYYVKGFSNTEVEDAKLVTGTVNGVKGTYLVRYGMVTSGSGVFKDSKGILRRITNGRVDKKFTGFTKDVFGDNKTYYLVVNGVVNLNRTGIFKGPLDDYGYYYADKTKRWYVKNGKVSFTDDVVKDSSGKWWKITEGMVDTEYYGYAKNSNGWFRIEAGKVNFNANGFYRKNDQEDLWFYCEGGKINFSFTGVAKVNENHFGTNQIGSWIYGKNGQFDSSFTGLCSNQSGTWWVNKGKINFSDAGMHIGYKKRYVIRGSKVIAVLDDSYMTDAEWRAMQTFPKQGYLGTKSTIEETELMYIRAAIERAKYFAPMYIAEFAARGIPYDETFATIMAATRVVSGFAKQGVYQSDYDRSTYYHRAYGVFVTGHYTCSGETRTMVQVLKEMGITAEHINEDLYTHQWAEFKYGNKTAFADADAGMAWFWDDMDDDGYVWYYGGGVLLEAE